MTSLAGRTLFITGASRGIGLAIALRAARDGANVAIAAKSSVPNPRLPGTIYTAAEAVNEAGGRGLALKCDIREEDEVHAAVAGGSQRDREANAARGTSDEEGLAGERCHDLPLMVWAPALRCLPTSTACG